MARIIYIIKMFLAPLISYKRLFQLLMTSQFYINSDNEKYTLSCHTGIVYLLAPIHSNIGDMAIYLKSIDFIKKNINIPLKIALPSRYCVIKKLKRIINFDDIIVLHGGGNLGSIYEIEEFLRQNIIKSFPRNKIISFPQSIYFSPSKKVVFHRAKKIYRNHENISIFVRDMPSLSFSQKYLTKSVYLVPDMVLSVIPKRDKPYEKNYKVLLCFRKDCESNINSHLVEDIQLVLTDRHYTIEYFDTDNLSGIEYINKEDKLHQILLYLQSFQFIVTDRYHATIFSYITETPCIAFDNNYGKVSNGFIWYKNCNYLFLCKTFDEYCDCFQKIDMIENFVWDDSLQNNFKIFHSIFTTNAK